VTDDLTNYQKGLFAVGPPEALAETKLVASTFPEGADYRFVLDILQRSDGAHVCTHLALGDWWQQMPEGQIELIAILCISERYHLFSTMPHMYGGFIHDDLGLGGWRICPGTGAIHRGGLAISLGQWGYFHAIARGLHPDDYLKEYLTHARQNGAELRLAGWLPCDRSALSNLITAKLKETDGGK